ncbi:hypothetical protein M427DRAFT_46196 [Gonapodya prolifera JEL478]|uniref:Reelin domain-containing protein n=1 Tax=Gonapodya prolifera (strain JEL478) TaxID=1344416 RepID=A0A139A7K8_GONPJ|nr:hypothetical protein M427DRAFT_46196 [Gonapodya prolifera JEL478]|eukprot:KXS12786.1 hypothetical protein M427DRAFT_46196 [Gonapodya prolifera JEL478]
MMRHHLGPGALKTLGIFLASATFVVGFKTNAGTVCSYDSTSDMVGSHGQSSGQSGAISVAGSGASFTVTLSGAGTYKGISLWARDASGNHLGAWTAPSGFAVKADCAQGTGLEHSNSNSKTTTDFPWSSTGVASGSTVLFEAVVLTSMQSWFTTPSYSFVVGGAAPSTASSGAASPTQVIGGSTGGNATSPSGSVSMPIPSASPRVGVTSAATDTTPGAAAPNIQISAMSIWLRQNRVYVATGVSGLFYLLAMTIWNAILKRGDAKRKKKSMAEFERTPVVHSLGICERDMASLQRRNFPASPVSPSDWSGPSLSQTRLQMTMAGGSTRLPTSSLSRSQTLSSSASGSRSGSARFENSNLTRSGSLSSAVSYTSPITTTADRRAANQTTSINGSLGRHIVNWDVRAETPQVRSSAVLNQNRSPLLAEVDEELEERKAAIRIMNVQSRRMGEHHEESSDSSAWGRTR